MFPAAVQATLLAAVLLLAVPCASKLVTFDNTKPRLTSSGQNIRAHDGTTQRFDKSGPYFYHAMGYPACNETGNINGCSTDPKYGKGHKTCIYGHNNSLLVYSSPDLSSGSWKLQEQVYPGNGGFPECTYFRSQAVYNPKTKKYVLWANVAGCRNGACKDRPNGKCAAYAMGLSDSAAGPYKFVGTAQPTAASMYHSGGIGDYALFVDTDGTGYIILTHGIDGPGHRDMYIFKLAPDFLSFESASSVGPLPGPHLVEAPAMFRRGDIYYALLGGCTCMGLYGGGVAVLTAQHPLGPWTNVTSTLDPGCPMEKQSTCFEMGPGAVCNPVTQAQQNYVITVPLANGSTAYIWTGDKVRSLCLHGIVVL